MKYMNLVFISLCLSLIACKGSKKASQDNTTQENSAEEMGVLPMELQISKGNCFGRCPVFELTIGPKGVMSYHGKMFVEKEGIWESSLTQEQLTEIQSKVMEANVFQYENEYRSGAMDYPQHSLRVVLEEKEKMIAGDFALPNPIKGIIAHMDSLSNMGEWDQIEAKVPRGALPGELIIKLKDLDPGPIQEAFSDYDLRMKKEVAPNLLMFVFTFSEEKISAGRILILIREHELVEQAQFNQRVAERQ
ncbi:MAG: hypothetical protein HKN16_11090 [Saprospiraceae bacterium]|nr:hypothetical protein [Saprospiraceae bacterium]